ncbi:MAG: DUF4388 domain-containing protein [Myxococcota bacterium]
MVESQGTRGRDQETELLLRSVAKAVRPFKAGSLDKVPLSHLMIYLETRRISGSLWLYDERHDSTVRFVRGAPAKVRTTLSVPHLGELLVQLGLIDQRAYDDTISFALRGGGLHGAMLVACGLLSQEQLEVGLREQTAMRLIEVFRHAGPSSRFAFYRDVDLLASWGGVEVTPVDPWWLLWWGNQDREADASVWEALELLGDEPLVLHPDAPLSRFGLGDAERSLLRWWSEQSAPVSALLSFPGLSQDRVAHLVLALFLTRNLSYDEAQPTRVRPAPAPEVRPPMESDTQLFVRRPVLEAESEPQPSMPDNTLRTGAPSFDDADVPVILDEGEPSRPGSAEVPPVPPAPPAPVVESTPPVQGTPVEQESQAQARMTQAFQTLLDPMEQEADQEPPLPRGPTYSELDLARSAEAMQLSSSAHAALMRGDIEEAERMAAAALERLPDNAVLKTDYAWAASLLPARRDIGDVGDLLDLLNEATEADPALDRAYYVRGTIFQSLGLHAKAYAEFRAAFARNAHNAEAAEKIQEYVRRMKHTGSLEPSGRPKQQPESAGPLGLLSKLWKRG